MHNLVMPSDDMWWIAFAVSVSGRARYVRQSSRVAKGGKCASRSVPGQVRPAITRLDLVAGVLVAVDDHVMLGCQGYQRPAYQIDVGLPGQAATST
jgi:hypothetical protein